MIAMMSSMQVGLSLRSTSRMPPDSNWNTRDRVAALEELEGRRVVERDRVEVDLDAVRARVISASASSMT